MLISLFFRTLLFKTSQCFYIFLFLFLSCMGSFFTTQIHPAMLHTAASLRLYTSPYFNANYTIISLLSMARILSFCLHLYVFMHVRLYVWGLYMFVPFYASFLILLYGFTSLRLYASTPLWLYASTPLHLCTSMPLRLWYFTLPSLTSLIGEAI